MNKHICEWCERRLDCMVSPELGMLIDDTGHPYQCEYLRDSMTPTMLFIKPRFSTELLTVLYFLPEGVLMSQQYWSEGNRLQSVCDLVEYGIRSGFDVPLYYPYPFPT